MNSDKLMIAKLSSGRQIMIVVNQDESNCSYRYLSDREIENQGFNEFGIFDWIETPIRTDEQNEFGKVVFIEVENQYIRWFLERDKYSLDDELLKVHNLGRFV